MTFDLGATQAGKKKKKAKKEFTTKDNIESFKSQMQN
jgi:hypothetical protein